MKERLDLHGKISTASVVVSSDRGLAEEVFKIACQYAKTANLYRASLEVAHVRQTERAFAAFPSKKVHGFLKAQN